jgi:hypothetical protein
VFVVPARKGDTTDKPATAGFEQHRVPNAPGVTDPSVVSGDPTHIAGHPTDITDSTHVTESTYVTEPIRPAQLFASPVGAGCVAAEAGHELAMADHRQGGPVGAGADV